MKIFKTFIDEVENNYISPSDESPDYIINYFCVPKKDNDGNYTKKRMVRHGSFSAKGKMSINDWIRSEKCKMESLPNLKDYIHLLIDKKFFALRDLSNAFRQLGLCPEIPLKIGYSVCGMFFIDNRQPYGIASAAANCQKFGDILLWIMRNKLTEHIPNTGFTVHIDDFVLAAKRKTHCNELECIFDRLCNNVGVKISTEKNVNTTTRATVYGLNFDLKNKTVSLPDKKYNRMKKLVTLTIELGYITGKALKSLTGNIMYISQLRKESKALCHRLIGVIGEKMRNKQLDNFQIFKLPDFVLRDLRFWLKYIDCIRINNMASIINNPSITIVSATDASSKAGGFIIGSKWGYFPFNNMQISWHINQKEAFVILEMIYSIKEFLSGKKLLIFTDNQAVFYSIKNKWSRHNSMMMFIYEICILLIKYKIAIWVEWIPTYTNIFADALSRNKLDTFHEDANKFGIKFDAKPILRETKFNQFEFTSNRMITINQ